MITIITMVTIFLIFNYRSTIRKIKFLDTGLFKPNGQTVKQKDTTNFFVIKRLQRFSPLNLFLIATVIIAIIAYRPHILVPQIK